MRLSLATCVALMGGLLAACNPPQPATLEFVDQSPAQPRLGETTTLRFRAIDSRGLPQAGVQVSFELQAPVAGVDLNPPTSSTDVGNGIASTQVVANGGRVSSVVVVARAGDRSAVSPAVTFAGSGSTSRQFTFQCGSVAGAASGGVHAINAYDETRSLIAGVKLNCHAHVADRNGDGIAGVQVSFLTEAGTIGPSSTSATDVIGNASVLYKTSLPLPDDVEPGAFTWNPNSDASHTGDYIAPLWMHPFEWAENPITNYGLEPTLAEPRRPDPIRRDAKNAAPTNNPRDNLVSMIAITTGEEAFDDLNNNGAWDPGEPFTDLTEPFVDNNDNGTWDAKERFVDANGNGKWDGKNGTFDPVTLIWVQERILWTGVPNVQDRAATAKNPRPVLRQLTPATTTAVRLDKFGIQLVEFLVDDPWFNGLARNGDSDGCETVEGGPVKATKLGSGRALTYPAYNLVRYLIQDTRDPASDPPPPDYPTTPTIKWSTSATCFFTGSPQDGLIVGVGAPEVSGDFIR